MNELHERLSGVRSAWEAQVYGAQLDEVAVRRIAGRARRTRALKAVAVGAAAAAVVGAVAVGAWSALGGEPDPIAPPPASPAPSPTASGPAIVDASAVRPVSTPVTEDVWAQVTEGWVLASWSAVDAGGEYAAPNAVYLFAPDGTAYLVLEQPVEYTVMSWVPGEREAWFSVCCDMGYAYIDLDTGEEAPQPAWLADSPMLVRGFLPDGRAHGSLETEGSYGVAGPESLVEIRVGEDVSPQPSPDGELLTANGRVWSTTTGEQVGYPTELQDSCHNMGWHNSTQLAYSCGDRDDAAGLVYANGSVWLVDAVSGETTEAEWPAQPGGDGLSWWATTQYVAMNGGVLAAAGVDPWLGIEDPNRHETPAGAPERTVPYAISDRGDAGVVDLGERNANGCARLEMVRPDLGLVNVGLSRAVDELGNCVQGTPFKNLYRWEDGGLAELVPALTGPGDIEGGIVRWDG